MTSRRAAEGGKGTDRARLYTYTYKYSCVCVWVVADAEMGIARWICARGCASPPSWAVGTYTQPSISLPEKYQIGRDV